MLSFGAGSLLGSPATERTAEQVPPGIVLIYVDDLGWRDLGFMGSSFYETPHIDRLARDGMVFSNAYANGPNCAPSRASLMSGQYPPRHGIYTVAPSNRGRAELRKLRVRETATDLELGVVTLAESLRQHGYATASMGKWHLGGDGHLPVDQGFDVNVAGDQWGHPQSYFWPYERDRGDRIVRIPHLQGRGTEGEYLTDRLTDEAIDWLQAQADRPFFLYLSHYAVHTPIQAKPELVPKYRAKPGDEGQNNARYAAMIESVDEGVGRLLDALEELGRADDTVVVFTSDNGGLGTVTSMAPLRGSKGMLYEGGIRVPLVVRWPGRAAAGSNSDVPIIGTDLYPTFLEISGAEPPDQVLDGLSMLPLLDGDEDVDPPPAFEDRALHWHFPAYLEAGGTAAPWRTTPAAAVRQGDLKLIEFFEDGRLELYDVAADPGEQHDLAEARPRDVRRLHTLMRQWREDTDAYVPRELNPEYDPGN